MLRSQEAVAMTTLRQEQELGARRGWRRRSTAVLVAAVMVIALIAWGIAATSHSEHRVRWSLSGITHGGRTLHLAAYGGGCDQGSTTRARVTEGAVRVQILLEVEKSGSTCPAVAFAWTVTVSLRQPLDGRTLAGCDFERFAVTSQDCSQVFAYPPRIHGAWPAPAASY